MADLRENSKERRQARIRWLAVNSDKWLGLLGNTHPSQVNMQSLMKEATKLVQAGKP